MTEGRYEVGTEAALRISLADRVDPLRVVALWPRNVAGSLPLIVFSHGLGGRPELGQALPRRWASAGYVCLLPEHADALVGGGLQGRSLAKEFGRLFERLKGRHADFLDRPRDITGLIDWVAALVEEPTGVPEKVDSRNSEAVVAISQVDLERVGVAGHSIGAYAAQLVAGARVSGASGELLSLRDHRVRAALLVSPQGTGRLGLAPESWQSVDLPQMSVTGSADWGAEGESIEWRREPFVQAPPGSKYHLVVEGATHASLVGEGSPRRGQRGVRMHRLLGDPSDVLVGRSTAERGSLARRIRTLLARRTEFPMPRLERLAHLLEARNWKQAESLRGELLGRGPDPNGAEATRMMDQLAEVTLAFWSAHLADGDRTRQMDAEPPQGMTLERR
ncbi:hypothetical protein MK489_04220 [Myxococcota bacterium]|nr:hypothetical protein [Myxococcota bacterium]